MRLIFFDDAAARALEPFALTRPACELRAGAELIRRRWESAFQGEGHAFVGAAHLADFEERGAVSALGGPVPEGAVLVNSRCAVALEDADRDASAWRCEGRLAAVRLDRSVDAARLAALGTLDELVPSDAVIADVKGWWIEHVWDLVRLLPEMLAHDIARLATWSRFQASPALTRLGAHGVCVDQEATIEPFVVADASSGPVLVKRGAVVQSYTRLVGPCVIGERSVVHGGRVAASSIGDECRVHGEVSVTIFTGHSNKAHDGFIGHSVLGRWVNLGASTVNSNLKNTYGAVSLWTPSGTRDTGMTFLGTMFGDHVKTAIGTRLTTGAVIGAGANVFGTGIVPKVVAPFSWGLEGGAEYALDRFLETASRMMARRDITLGARARRQLAAAWQRRWPAAG